MVAVVRNSPISRVPGALQSRLSKSAKSTARLLTFICSHGSLREVSQAPNGSFDSNGAFFFQHSTFVLGEVCRLDPSGFSRLDRLRLRRPCLLPLLRAPCGRLSGFKFLFVLLLLSLLFVSCLFLSIFTLLFSAAFDSHFL